MLDSIYSAKQIAAITQFVDTEMPTTGTAAYFIFGTNQIAPVDLVAERHGVGLAPLIIATGGINRHNGVIEGQEFQRLLVERGVSESAIRVEDKSTNTWQNVEYSIQHLREATQLGLPIIAVCKWYHRRAIHCLATLFPEIGKLFAVTYEPTYSGRRISRSSWVSHPDGRQKVIREWQEVPRRISEGSYRDLEKVDGAWQLA